jgi:PPOX class probable F420-dependent enzyme
MLDFSTPFGLRVAERLRSEPILWLTTVDAAGTPQPRPVWFQWDGETLLIYSQPHAAKVRHIRRQPRVAMHFNTDSEGNDYAVLLGHARIAEEAVPPERLRASLDKYAVEIPHIGYNETTWQAEWSLPILCTPERMRGW